MLREKGFGHFIQISSKTHKGRAKKYYLTENYKALKCLNRFRDKNVIKKEEN